MSNTEHEVAEPHAAQVRELLGERAWGELARRLGFEVVDRAIPTEALDAWGVPRGTEEVYDELVVLGVRESSRLLLARGVDRYSSLRRALLGAHRRNPAQCVVWWIVGERRATVASIADGRDGRPFVRRMETDLEHPDPVAVRQWCALYAEELADADLADPGRAYHRHVHDVLRQEAVTREFFEGFREALHRMTNQLRGGPTDDELRHDVSLATLLRLVFLYLLQERGALDGDRRFVMRHYRRTQDAGGAFYEDVLRPLFFGALNRVPEERADRARELGELPFLNGGLFEPLPAERAHPDLTWPNEIWSNVIEDLLERFQFAVDEGVGPDENRAVDPEMLGKVFEGLMYGERRHDSGSFYTPRDVVRSVVSDAVAEHISDETTLEPSKLHGLVEGRQIELAPCEQRELAEVLESFHLLDPAVGTGAFLLEALRVLERLYAAAGDAVDARTTYERRRHIVHEHLFGVDIQRPAVRICELRIWLALLSVMPESWSIRDVPPLPNLSHRIACGNSLMTPADRMRPAVGERPGRERGFGSVGDIPLDHQEEMAELQNRYLDAHGDQKAELQRQIEQLERQLQLEILQSRRATLEEKVEPYEKLESSEDLFGEDVELERAQREEKERLTDRLEAMRDAIEDLRAGRADAGGFSFAARFGPKVGSEGFDIVVTNPPWVRGNRLDRGRRRRLKKRYRSFSSELWSGSEELGVSIPFGAQVDLAALFVERCLELLAPGGHLGALVPAKLFRSLHGSGLRGVVAEHRVEAVRDYSESDRDMFDATVYPAALRVEKREARHESRTRRTGRAMRAQQTTPVDLTVWSGSRRREWTSEIDELPAVGRDVREPWLFVPPEVSELFDVMWEHAEPLGRIPELQPKRGLMTGCNRVFVRDSEVVASMLGDRTAEWSRPALSGRDIRAWSIEPDERLLWGYDEALEPREDLPEQLEEHFREHEAALQGRADFNSSGPLWQLFRLKPGLSDWKVVWRDLAPRLEAASAAPEVIPLNTVYFIPVASRGEARVVASLFNSEPVRAYAYALGERARGRWRRHFCWVMRMLPVPERLAARMGSVAEGEGTDIADQLRKPDSRSDVDAWSADLFGLDSTGLDRLRRWRLEACDAENREAA